MKEGELKDLFRQSGPDPLAGEDPVRVLVSVNARVPSPALLADLKGLGLTVDRIIGSTLPGTIDP